MLHTTDHVIKNLTTTQQLIHDQRPLIIRTQNGITANAINLVHLLMEQTSQSDDKYAAFALPFCMGRCVDATMSSCVEMDGILQTSKLVVHTLLETLHRYMIKYRTEDNVARWWTEATGSITVKRFVEYGVKGPATVDDSFVSIVVETGRAHQEQVGRRWLWGPKPKQCQYTVHFGKKVEVWSGGFIKATRYREVSSPGRIVCRVQIDPPTWF